MMPRFRGPWHRMMPPVFENGDVGGDLQLSRSWAARWWRLVNDGTSAVVTRSFYVVSSPGGRRIEQQNEFQLCGDPHDPGSTETWSDATYEHGSPARSVTSLAALDGMARAGAYAAVKPTAIEERRFPVGVRG